MLGICLLSLTTFWNSLIVRRWNMTAEELNEELQNFDYPPYIPKNES